MMRRTFLFILYIVLSLLKIYLCSESDMALNNDRPNDNKQSGSKNNTNNINLVEEFQSSFNRTSNLEINSLEDQYNVEAIFSKYIQPLHKIINANEEMIPIISINSDSTFTKEDADGNTIIKLNAKNLLYEGIWCSTGNHGINDEINLHIEFETIQLINSFWIHWAYAPGEIRVRYSSNHYEWKDIFAPSFRISNTQTDLNNIKKLMKDPRYFTKFRSFDEKIYLDKIDYAKFIEITMRIPINNYFGIQKLEFYELTQTVVTFKSEIAGEELCLSVSDIQFRANSLLLAQDCIRLISYGDNRDVFILNSNGYITPYSQPNMCIQSDSIFVSLIQCAVAEEFRDDRHKWIMEPNGLIRSKKDVNTCINIEHTSEAFGSLLGREQIIVTASSTQADNQYKADNTLDYIISGSYWASEPLKSTNEVEFKMEFKFNLCFPVHLLRIKWKFPAKDFEIVGKLCDQTTKIFERVEGNRKTFTEHFIKGYQLTSLTIRMNVSTMRIDNKNIYGIFNVFVLLDGRIISREKCIQSIENSNRWKMIRSNYHNREQGLEYQKSSTILNNMIQEMKVIQTSFEKVPSVLSTISENDAEIDNLFKTVDEIISEFKSSLGPASNRINLKVSPDNYDLTGDTESTPAVDCASIQSPYLNKRSGFYWVKNECMKKPLRVFCNFNKKDKTSLDYYIFDMSDPEIQQNFLLNDKIPKNRGDVILTVQKKCAELGLEPLEIKNLDILNTLLYLIQLYNFKYGDDSLYIFPIGVDYGSESNAARSDSQYFSFHKNSGSDVIELLKQIDDEANSNSTRFKRAIEMMDSIIREDDFDIENLDNHRYDFIAVGSLNKITLSYLIQSKIIGFACSSNRLQTFAIDVDSNNSTLTNNNLNKNKEIKCDTTLSTFLSEKDKISDSSFTNFVVICPKNCAENFSPVYGSEVYTDQSSICKAGIHSGIFQDRYGGYLAVSIVNGLEFYKESVSNQVESKEFTQKQLRSFKLGKYEIECPNSNLILETLDNSKEKTQSSNAVNPSKMNHTSFLSIEENERFNNYRNFNQSSILENNEASLKNTSRLYRISKSDEDFDLLNLIKKYKSKDKMTTENALIQLETINQYIQKDIKNTERITKALKILASKTQGQISYYKTDSNRGLEKRWKSYDVYVKQINEINKWISSMEMILSESIIKAEDDLLNLRDEISETMRRENFQEDYTYLSISTNYQVFNSKKQSDKQNDPANWNYYIYNINGHNKVIKQTDPFWDTRSGSHLIIKGKEFYDFELKVSVYIPKDNLDTFGVAFRYIDPYTNYIFEISKRENGYKRIRKFIKGEQFLIKIKYDGGYNVDEWLDVKIRGINSNFKIYTKPQSLSGFSQDYELVFEFNDNSIMHGTMAFTSLMMNNLMLDDISVVQINCTDYSQINKVKDIRRIDKNN